MAIFDGAAGDAPVFDALDVPTHVTLRRAVRNHEVSGYGMALVGLAFLAALVAAGERAEAIAALPMAALFGAFMWRLLGYHRHLRAALAAPRPAGEAATFVSGPSLRAFLGPVMLTLTGAIPMAFGVTPGAFVALGFAAVELLVSARMRGWERRNGQQLYVAGAWRNRLYAR